MEVLGKRVILKRMVYNLFGYSEFCLMYINVIQCVSAIHTYLHSMNSRHWVPCPFFSSLNITVGHRWFRTKCKVCSCLWRLRAGLCLVKGNNSKGSNDWNPMTLPPKLRHGKPGGHKNGYAVPTIYFSTRRLIMKPLFLVESRADFFKSPWIC